jgi:nicotinamidase-related amidase
MKKLLLPAHYYQQFDADYGRRVPAEGFGGWKTARVELAPRHTALVVMHAWDCGGPDEYPGWRRAVECHPRALRILKEVFPPLLAATRASPLPVLHVVGGGDYYRRLPGYRRARRLAGPAPSAPQAARDPVHRRLERFRADHVFVGARNRPDVDAGFRKLDFAPEARPAQGEGVAEDGRQLGALCHEMGINHLVYAGFAINWCLLMSPGGMVDMRRQGFLCSTIREAVTAVENRETARTETEKRQALWRVSVEFGFVFGLEDFLAAVSRAGGPRKATR